MRTASTCASPRPQPASTCCEIRQHLPRLGLDALWIGRVIGEAGERQLSGDEDPAILLDGVAERRDRLGGASDHVEERGTHRVSLAYRVVGPTPGRCDARFQALCGTLLTRASGVLRAGAALPGRAASAALTRSGVKGTARSLTPVASKTAFARAAATGAVEASPAPNRRQCWSVKEGHLDGRHFWEGQNRIAHPVHAGDAGAIERHFLVQRAAQRLHDRPFDLVAQPIGIDDQPAVVRTGDALHADPATRRIDRHSIAMAT